MNAGDNRLMTLTIVIKPEWNLKTSLKVGFPKGGEDDERERH